MLYFSMDTEEESNEYGMEEENEITWADILRVTGPEPVLEPILEPALDTTDENEWNYGKETYTQDEIRRTIDATNAHINELFNSIQSLSNYTNICYANREDVRPFGPDTLFQIKWCRDYHIQSQDELMSETSIDTYQEYKECANILLRAYSAACKIRNPGDDEQIAVPNDYETWFKDQTHYELLVNLYYKTLNIRDEEAFGAFYA